MWWEWYLLGQHLSRLDSTSTATVKNKKYFDCGMMTNFTRISIIEQSWKIVLWTKLVPSLFPCCRLQIWGVFKSLTPVCFDFPAVSSKLFKLHNVCAFSWWASGMKTNTSTVKTKWPSNIIYQSFELVEEDTITEKITLEEVSAPALASCYKEHKAVDYLSHQKCDHVTKLV